MASCSFQRTSDVAWCCFLYPAYHHIIPIQRRFHHTETLSSTMGHGLGLGKAVDSADDRAMIKSKPSLPANSQNQGGSNTLDYAGFWQQKAALHFTNSAYKGTWNMTARNQMISESSNIDQLTSSTNFLLCFVSFVIFQSSNLLVPRSLSFRVSWRLMPRRCFTWDMRVCASTTTSVPWSISNGHTILTAVELPYDC